MNEELDLLDLFYAFWKKRIWLILAIIVGVVAGFVYTKYMIVPEYSSSVRIVLAKDSENTASAVTSETYDSITQTDITLNQKLLSTYSEILKSKKICNKVIENLKIDMSCPKLIKCINVSSVKDTEIILLKITTENAELSKRIASEMTNVFRETVNEIYNIKNIIILDEAEINNNPVNVSYIKNIAIFSLVLLAVVSVIIFLNYYFDNTVKTEENVQKLTGLPVLSSIPNVKKNKNDKKDKKGGKKRA